MIFATNDDFAAGNRERSHELIEPGTLTLR
jgi:hypothetical protein